MIFWQVSSSASESKLNKTIGNLDSKPYTGGAISQSGPSLSESSRAAIKGTRWEAMDNEIDANLGETLVLCEVEVIYSTSVSFLKAFKAKFIC